MIFTVTMKDPDTLYDAISEELDQNPEPTLDDEEWEAIKEIRREKVQEIASQWFDMGEYLTVRIDTEKNTITVVPVQDLT